MGKGTFYVGKGTFYVGKGTFYVGSKIRKPASLSQNRKVGKSQKTINRLLIDY